MTYCQVNWVHYKYASFHVGRLGGKKKFIQTSAKILAFK